MKFLAISPTLFLIAIFSIGLTANAGRDGTGRVRPQAVRVQFNDLGNGADLKAKAAIRKVIAKGVVRDQISIYRQRVTGGKGESTLCIGFSDQSLADGFLQNFNSIAARSNIGSSYPSILVQSVPECTELALNPINLKGTSSEQILLDTWTMTNEQDGSEGTIFRSSNYQLPVGGAKETMTFGPNGTFTQSWINDAGKSVKSSGSWAFKEPSDIEISFKDRSYPDYKMRIEGLSDLYLSVRIYTGNYEEWLSINQNK